eukprot:1325638-Karenia_brevis.AAC.1
MSREFFLKAEYLFARRRFRRFAKKGPRGHRFPTKSAWSFKFRSHGKGVVVLRHWLEEKK